MLSRIVSGVTHYTAQVANSTRVLARVGLKATKKPGNWQQTVGESFKAFKKEYPIASRLLKRDELIKGAILTRLIVAFSRVFVNIPRADTKVDLTRAQKYQSLFERIFMEPIGCIFQVITLFFSQELVSRLLEKSGFCNTPSANRIKAYAHRFHPELIKTASKASQEELDKEAKAIARVLQEVYTTTKGSVANKLNNPSSIRNLAQDIDLKVLQHLNQFLNVSRPQSSDALIKIQKLTQTALNQYLFRLRQAGLITLGVGVLSSAIVAGYVNQKLNDTVFSNKVAPWLLAKLGIVSKGKSDFNYVRYQLPTIRERIYWI